MNWTKRPSEYLIIPFSIILLLSTLGSLIFVSFHIIRALEHKRTITSVSLAEERQILKEINSLKRTKLQVEEYNKMDEQAQSMKVRMINYNLALQITIVGRPLGFD